MNEIYSEVIVARFKRSSTRPTASPVAFRIEAGAQVYTYIPVVFYSYAPLFL